jgi:hypothetical protein
LAEEGEFMNKTMLAAAFLFLISVSAYSTHEEDYYGRYQSINPKCKIAFTFDEKGVSNLSVNKLRFNKDSVINDLLGAYSNSLLFQIEFDDLEGYSNTIKLLILQMNREIVIVSGYYIRFKYNEKTDTSIILEKCALELIRQ